VSRTSRSADLILKRYDGVVKEKIVFYDINKGRGEKKDSRPGESPRGPDRAGMTTPEGQKSGTRYNRRQYSHGPHRRIAEGDREEEETGQVYPPMTRPKAARAGMRDDEMPPV
jgi:hypothetical protein